MLSLSLLFWYLTYRATGKLLNFQKAHLHQMLETCYILATSVVARGITLGIWQIL